MQCDNEAQKHPQKAHTRMLNSSQRSTAVALGHRQTLKGWCIRIVRSRPLLYMLIIIEPHGCCHWQIQWLGKKLSQLAVQVAVARTEAYCI